MTQIMRSEWVLRGASLFSCFLLAGCIGSGGGNRTTPIVEGPAIIVDQPDPVRPERPEDPAVAPEEEEDIVTIVTDIVTDILTTTVTVTTMTSTSGS